MYTSVASQYLSSSFNRNYINPGAHTEKGGRGEGTGNNHPTWHTNASQLRTVPGALLYANRRRNKINSFDYFERKEVTTALAGFYAGPLWW